MAKLLDGDYLPMGGTSPVYFAITTLTQHLDQLVAPLELLLCYLDEFPPVAIFDPHMLQVNITILDTYSPSSYLQTDYTRQTYKSKD